MRINVSAPSFAMMVNGQLVIPFPERDEEGNVIANQGAGADGSVDLYLQRGLHNISIFAFVEGGEGTVSATRARENPNTAAVTMVPFQVADFDLQSEEAKNMSVADQRPLGGLRIEGKGVADSLSLNHSIRPQTIFRVLQEQMESHGTGRLFDNR